jgi:hypothetical protein
MQACPGSREESFGCRYEGRDRLQQLLAEQLGILAETDPGEPTSMSKFSLLGSCQRAVFENG